MSSYRLPWITRRRFTAFAVGVAATTLLRPCALWGREPRVREFELELSQAEAPLLGATLPKVNVWAFNRRVPGSEIRVRHGERVRVMVTNRLREETTVHWHGVRVPNSQDGVPHLTQKPIAPGEHFVYEFDCLDAGTFWYHPHVRSFEQVGRGLYGAFIVEESEPIAVDRDVVWVLDDWRFDRSGQLSDDFGDLPTADRSETS